MERYGLHMWFSVFCDIQRIDQKEKKNEMKPSLTINNPQYRRMLRLLVLLAGLSIWNL